MPPDLILASASDARASLLRSAAVSFAQSPARIDEEAIRAALQAEGARPRDMADALAEFKALKVSERQPDALVIGSDQILDLDGSALGKCHSREALRTRLTELRGRRHALHSAAVIAQAGKPLWRHVASARLTMRDFSDGYLDAYLARNWPEVADSVGGYHVEGEGIRLFSAVEGSWPVILGMPLLEILVYLGRRGDIAA